VARMSVIFIFRNQQLEFCQYLLAINVWARLIGYLGTGGLSNGIRGNSDREA